ncbi:MAG: hypothetical protein NT013_16080 [Planctomycetia bacterium]|nr:hypothetical protein [Planctomycetia bacterium]
MTSCKLAACGDGGAKLWLTDGAIFGDTSRWWTLQIAIRVQQMRSINWLKRFADKIRP